MAGSNIDLLLTWPLDFIVADHFVPDQAPPLLRALVGLDDESAGLTIKLWAMSAQCELSES